MVMVIFKPPRRLTDRLNFLPQVLNNLVTVVAGGGWWLDANRRFFYEAADAVQVSPRGHSQATRHGGICPYRERCRPRAIDLMSQLYGL